MLDFDRGIYALAPLAGYTDLPFRALVKKFGADLTISEMISANALVYNSKKTYEMLKKSPLESPYIVQLAGYEIESIKKAVEILNGIDGIDGIDLNCGCPVPKVVAQKAGSALLQDLSQTQRLLETIKKYSNKKYTSAKIRLGFNEKIPEKIALATQSAGVDYITIHGRTRAGRYKAEVDYEAIAAAKKAVKIPVIANGDIVSLKKAKEVKKITSCNSLMIGRGAIGNPWIFYQLKNDIEDVSKEKIQEIVLEHYDNMLDFYGVKGAYIFRKHLHTYSKGFPDAASFRDLVNRIDDVVEMRDAIEDFFA
jgi:tRNA-dihydrouridine synthase B